MPAPGAAKPATQSVLSIDELVKNGSQFYSEEKDSDGNYIGVAVALQKAYDKMGNDVVIASMPYLIAGKANADKKIISGKIGSLRFLRKMQALTRTESLPRQGKKLSSLCTAEGILTPERIRQAYSEGLTPQNAAKYTDEFDSLLKGVLPSGESIDLYTVDDVKKGIIEPFGRYAVWMLC